MVDLDLVARKLARLKGYVQSLREADDITWEAYQNDARAKAFVERYMHLAIEEVLDVANHIVSFHGWREPEGYRDLFTVLCENGVIPRDQLPTFQNMAGFRNMLVHRYERIDDEVVYGLFRKNLGDFDAFAERIRSWAQRQAS
jgi:uncharacterized protein YutE (UPF0331/DUF86 family)